METTFTIKVLDETEAKNLQARSLDVSLAVHKDKKVLDVTLLREFGCKQRHEGLKIVFTRGVFDVFHAGHARYLSIARQLGDVLVVGLNTDISVKA